MRSFYIDNKFTEGNEIEIYDYLKEAKSNKKKKSSILKQAWKEKWSKCNECSHSHSLNSRQLHKNQKL